MRAVRAKTLQKWKFRIPVKPTEGSLESWLEALRGTKVRTASSARLKTDLSVPLAPTVGVGGDLKYP